MHLVSCTNTHPDIIDLVNYGIVKNTKTWISWEWKITFLKNKKTLNLCLKWQILRSFCFVGEVTFKVLSLSRIFVEFISDLYILPWLRENFKFMVFILLEKAQVSEKTELRHFTHAARQNSGSYHHPPGRRKLLILPRQRFFNLFSPSRKERGEYYDVICY